MTFYKITGLSMQNALVERDDKERAMRVYNNGVQENGIQNRQFVYLSAVAVLAVC